ncbi:MAG: DAK2 domain-containing protein [Clostridia bacterium]|nr:DAK2 domain-containing protein [Clostridia bacterium]
MIKSIDVKMLRDMISGACQNLAVYEQEINAHNVFPVPDGDTGTNMCATAASAAREIQAIKEEELSWEKFSSALSIGALRGARGNSGVILTQIFKGISDVTGETAGLLSLKNFSKALQQGAKVAYGAVNKPKEGTILTVIRVVAEESEKWASGRNACFETMMRKLLEKGNAILAETPNMLPVLKKAGVVDAGGMGLMRVLEGLTLVIEGKEIPKVAVKVAADEFDAGFAADVHDLDDIEFAYCTEFFVKNIRPRATESDIDKLRDKLARLGNSLICIGDLELVKVHVHTNNPGRALQYALDLGELDRVKIENMLEQNRKIKAEMEKNKKPIGMVAVCAGAGIKQIFKDLLVDVIVEGGQTMNPSVNEILSAINRVNADSVIVLPNNSNIILAAEKAMEMASRHCVVLPTKSVAAGIAAAIAFDQNASTEENVAAMKEAFESVKCAQVTTAVRSTKMDGLSLKEGDIIGLSDKKILTKGDSAIDVVSALVKKMGMDEMDVLNLYSGEGVTEEDVNAVVDRLAEDYPDLEVITYKGDQPHSFYILAAE